MCGLGHTFLLRNIQVMNLNSVVDEKIESYIRGLMPERDQLLTRLEEKAAREFVSIVVPEVAQFLRFMATQAKAKNILEIGTAIGYSTILLARIAQANGGKVTTIEINQPRYEKAQQSVQESGLADIITIIKSHAADILPNLQEEYDFIFVDAAKGQYGAFFEQLYPRLSPGGVIIFDNVLADGLLVEKDEDIERRQRTMVRKLREFLQMITTHQGLVTSIIPIGDGMVVSNKLAVGSSS